MLNSVLIPAGVDDLAVRKQLLGEFGIEIGSGLGPLKGKTWRIGLMGETSTASNVLLFLARAGAVPLRARSEPPAVAPGSRRRMPSMRPQVDAQKTSRMKAAPLCQGCGSG